MFALGVVAESACAAGAQGVDRLLNLLVLVRKAALAGTGQFRLGGGAFAANQAHGGIVDNRFAGAALVFGQQLLDRFTRQAARGDQRGDRYFAFDVEQVAGGNEAGGVFGIGVAEQEDAAEALGVQA